MGKNGKKNHKVIASSSDIYHYIWFYNSVLLGSSKRDGQAIPKNYNIHPVTEIGGQIDDETTANIVSIIKMSQSSSLVTKSAMASMTRSVTR